ncbi:HutD/Ves family protein [Castellaniella sp. WN]
MSFSRDGSAAATRLHFIRAAELRESPWKNGGGITREITVHPAGAGLDDFLWRVSAADVAAPGPFSRWEGVDRVLLVTRGGPIRLIQEDTGRAVVLPAGQGFRFAGEESYRCELPAGPVRDFNLMLRRTKAQGHVTTFRGAVARRLAPGHWLWHGWHGAYEMDLPGRLSRGALEAGDTLHLSVPAGDCPVLRMTPKTEDARLIVTRIEMA